jgi:hypothetical protein
MECWFKTSDTANKHAIVEYGDMTGYGPQLWNFDTATKAYVNFVDKADMPHTVMSPDNAATPGNWHHMVATYGGTGLLFLDGRKIGEVAGPFDLKTDLPLNIGQRAGATDGLFSGSIDEVAIYDHALSEAAIALHIQTARKGRVARAWAPFEWFP